MSNKDLLLMRVARLKRLQELNAPIPIIENECSLVQKSIAEASPGDMLFLVDHFDEQYAKYTGSQDDRC
jgi:uncharacterized protein YfaT (DUF1175 family)